MRSFSVSGSSFSVETSEGRPGTKYMFVRDMSPYADNVYSSNDKSAHGRSTAGVAVRVGGSTMAVDCDKRGSKTLEDWAIEVIRVGMQDKPRED